MFLLMEAIRKLHLLEAIRKKAVANCSVVVGYLHNGQYSARIIALKSIAPHHEIITKYGRNKVHPTNDYSL